jgi:structural maintenance of chromosome 2
VKNVSRDKAKYALTLIRYHANVENSMKYVFGEALICEDSEIAKKLAFDP